MNTSTDNIVRFKQWTCRVVFTQYQDNHRLAILLLDAETGERIAVATVNIPDEYLQPDEVIIKNYSENEGILPVLEEAGIVAPPHRIVQAGYTHAGVCKLLVPLDE